MGLYRQDSHLAALGLTGNAESLGNGRAGDVGVQYADVIAAAGHQGRQHRRDGGFADAAFAAADSHHFLDRAVGVQGSMKVFFAAVFAAAFTVMSTFTHGGSSFPVYILAEWIKGRFGLLYNN